MILARPTLALAFCGLVLLTLIASPSQAEPVSEGAQPVFIQFSNPSLINEEEITELQIDDQLEAYVERADGNRDSLGVFAYPLGYDDWENGAPVNLKVIVPNREAAEFLSWIPRDAIAFKVRKAKQKVLDPADVLRYLMQKETGLEKPVDEHRARIFDAIINEDAVEITPQFIRNTAPLKSTLWDAQRGSQRFANTTTLRVFLEKPEPNEVLTLAGTSGIKMYVRGTEGSSRQADGMYHVAKPGDFSGTQMYGSDPGQLRITSPYHYPAEIEVARTAEIGQVLGEFMLRRPIPEETAELQVELADADNNPITDWTFAYGAITWGGPYGNKQNLNSDGIARIQGLAPQSFSIGFLEKPIAKDRANVELKPGQIATVRFQLDAEGELTKPDISYEPRQQ